jgi:hypothetical protein
VAITSYLVAYVSGGSGGIITSAFGILDAAAGVGVVPDAGGLELAREFGIKFHVLPPIIVASGGCNPIRHGAPSG